MDTLQKHPVWVWISILIALVSFLSTVVGAFLYLESFDVRLSDLETAVRDSMQREETRDARWMSDDDAAHARIEDQIVELRQALARTRENLTVTIDRHEEFVSGEHVSQLEALNDLYYRLGLIGGRVCHGEGPA